MLGDAGIGKSTLTRAASRQARTAGLRVLETTGVEAEAQLPFAGLHQLLRPLLSAADALPATQQRALGSAFGAEDGPRPEFFMIALADQCLSEYDEHGWTGDTWINPDDVAYGAVRAARAAE